MNHLNRVEIQQQLKEHGIDPNHIKTLHVQLQSGALDYSSFVINAERLRPPTTTDVDFYNQLDSATLSPLGTEALQNDQLLVFWLNGGAATRYFDASKVTPEEAQRYAAPLNTINEELQGSPKGITEVVEGMSYLELKIRNLLFITKQHNLDVHPQVMIMNSFITDAKTRPHLEHLFKKYPDLDPERFHFIIQEPTIPRFQRVQDLKNIDVFVTNQEKLSFAPCGHGDFVYLLQNYFAQHPIPNVKYMFFANIDNLGSTLDATLLGYHIFTGQSRTVELAAKLPGDKGGAPCFVDNELLIIEQMKFPSNFDQDTIPWFNTNNFWFNIQDLLQFNEDLPFILAEKTIAEGEVFQLERFACDVHLPSKYIVIERTQRFWPIKRYVDTLLYQDPQANQEMYQAFAHLLKANYSL